MPPTTRRRAAVLASLVLAVALVLTGCGRGAPAPTEPGRSRATVGLTYLPDVQFAPFYVADAGGLFAERGVDVTLRHHGAQEGLFTALLAGQEDFVLAGGDEVVQARAQGADLVAIAQYYHRYPVVILVPDASPIRTAADLRGRTVGVPGRYGETWFGLQAALASAGMTDADVGVVEIGYTQQAALTTGRVEAVIGFANNEQVQFAAAGVPVRAVPLVESGDVPLVSIALVTTGDVLRRDRAAASGVARGMVAGVERTVQDPAAALEASRKHVPTLSAPGALSQATATLTATAALWKNVDDAVTGAQDQARWAAMTEFMHARGLIAQPVDAEQAVTNDMLER